MPLARISVLVVLVLVPRTHVSVLVVLVEVLVSVMVHEAAVGLLEILPVSFLHPFILAHGDGLLQNFHLLLLLTSSPAPRGHQSLPGKPFASSSPSTS